MDDSDPATGQPERRSGLMFLRHVFEQSAMSSGDIALENIVRGLGTLFNAETTFIAMALDTPPTRVRGLAAWKDGARKEPWEFDLAGNPCQHTYDGKPTFIPCDVAKDYLSKSESGYESYIGIPLSDIDGTIIGHLAVYSSKKLRVDEYAMELAQLCGFHAQTELRRMLAVEAQRAAEADNEAKSEFLAMMSHEIRTPLSGVLAVADLILQTDVTPHQRELLKTMRKAGDGLVNTLNDVVDLSKIRAGKFDIAMAEYEPAELLQSCADLMVAKAREKDLALNHEIDADVPATVTGDQMRVRQIITNFLSNALKFTAEGHVSLSLTTATGADGTPMIKYTVSDTGEGIEADALATVFDPYEQAGNTITRTHGGAGLGLSICKQLADLMGGDVGVESAAGQGSTFWVMLPVSAPKS